MPRSATVAQDAVVADTLEPRAQLRQAVYAADPDVVAIDVDRSLRPAAARRLRRVIGNQKNRFCDRHEIPR